MKKTLSISIITFTLLSSFVFSGNTVKEAEFTVSGNCTMCKNRIEKAVKISEVKSVKWDKKTKKLNVAFLSEKITLDSIQQRLAFVGHDTEKFKAADSVYANLPDCCLYRD
jgi:copper chaperone CopZ